VLHILRQVASGLAAIHAIGLLHRDVSPNNIMVLDDDVAKVLDLGLAKNVDSTVSMDSHGAFVGTMAYVSPEQLDGGEPRFASEVFVFGVILYEALAGVHPFRAEHPMTLLNNIAQREPEPLASRLPDCPAPLADLVTRCLAKRPEDRPASIADVAARWTSCSRAPTCSRPPRRSLRRCRVRASRHATPTSAAR
jgi:serine/threonine-protein kinase